MDFSIYIVQTAHWKSTPDSFTCIMFCKCRCNLLSLKK